MVAQWRGCDGSVDVRCGSSVEGMWWLSRGDMVAQWKGSGGSVEGMWWLSEEDVVAQWKSCGGSVDVRCGSSVEGM
jgi:hypothetical protein